MGWFRRHVTSQDRPERISLSVLEPPCRCREPLVADAVRGLDEGELDLLTTSGAEQMGPALRAVDSLESGDVLRVRAHGVYWPLMAALLASGCRYQILDRTQGATEYLVWRLYSPEEHSSYLHGCMCEASRA